MKNKERIDSRKTISDYIFYSKYSRVKPDGKKETWEESVSRVMQMHWQFFENKIDEENKSAFYDVFQKAWNAYNKKQVLGSQRALQYGGPQLLKNNLRSFNCSGSYCNRVQFFQELEILLLSGAGAAYSVQKIHTNQLPIILGVDKTQKELYVIEDSIEGWSLSTGKLIESYYFHRPQIEFDYSLIRPEGAYVSGGFKAPGPEPLKKSHDKIRSILEKIDKRKARPFELHWIACIIADAVISGGIRRSAMLAMFDKDDQEMMKCKTGDWLIYYPELCRCNNSVCIYDDCSYEEYQQIFENIKEYGEPGIIFPADNEVVTNPCCETNLLPTFYNEDGSREYGWSMCVSEDTKLITKDGIRIISDCVNEEISIWNGQKWTKVIPYQTGDQDELYRVYFSDGSYLDVTNNHKFLWRYRENKTWKEATTLELIKMKESDRRIIVPRADIVDFDFGRKEEFAYEYGFFQGDGTISLKKNNRSKKIFKYLNCDIFEGTGKEFLPLRYRKMDHSYISSSNKSVIKYQFDEGDIELCEQLKDVTSGIPEEIFGWDRESILNYVAGWADADGSNASKGIRIYGGEFKIRDLQLLLTKVGINSSVCLFKKAGSKSNFGIHNYDLYFLQITTTKDIPCHRLNCNNSDIPRAKGKYVHIKKIEKLEGLHKSYCLTEEELHQCVFNNILTKQCNLCEINGALVQTEEDFYKACEAAAILGTLQAAYTENLSILTPTTKKIMERDALLGVGITGMADNPTILFNEQIQRNGAEIVKKTNSYVAKILGINEAARTTVIKPSGNASQLLMCGSGCHAYHYRKYIRNIQANNNEQAFKEISKNNKNLVSRSYWNPVNESVLSFPIELDSESMVRTDFSTIDFLKRIYSTQKNWIKQGTNEHHPSTKQKPKYSHNVSCTVSVKDDEWKEVADWIWNHKDGFFGLSFLPETGALDYPQAPYTPYLDEKELVEEYGEGAILSSGLIVDGLDVFNDIWTATNAALGRANSLLVYNDDYLFDYLKKHLKDGKLLVEIDGLYVSDVNAISSHLKHKVDLRNDWVRRFKKFAENYFEGDLHRCSNCLKQVNIFHQWHKIKDIQSIDWESVEWETILQNAGDQVGTACSGGKCEI